MLKLNSSRRHYKYFFFNLLKKRIGYYIKKILKKIIWNKYNTKPRFCWLTLKAPITTKAIRLTLELKQTTILSWVQFWVLNLQKKTSLDIPCESSAKQTIHMKYQDLFSLKKKNFRMSSATNFAWCFNCCLLIVFRNNMKCPWLWIGHFFFFFSMMCFKWLPAIYVFIEK